MFPDSPGARDRFVLDRRRPRLAPDPWRSQGVEIEEERTSTGDTVGVATVFLTGRECPWRCTMCDLWQYTTEDDTPPGAIARQVAEAVNSLGATPDVKHLKLYNAGSFFDPRAVPPEDLDAVAASVGPFERLIVESHPTLVGHRTTKWLETLRRANPNRPPPRLEVALGLETTHPVALDRLNKRMTVDDFRRAAERLATLEAALRVFLLVSPPFVPAERQDEWLVRSVEVAVSCGAAVVSLIPTRSGNGAVEALASAGDFAPPRLTDLERSLDLALRVSRPEGTRVFADLWNLDRVATCRHCLEARRARLRGMNLSQRTAPLVRCAHCSGSYAA